MQGVASGTERRSKRTRPTEPAEELEPPEAAAAPHDQVGRMLPQEDGNTVVVEMQVVVAPSRVTPALRATLRMTLDEDFVLLTETYLLHGSNIVFSTRLLLGLLMQTGIRPSRKYLVRMDGFSGHHM